MALVPSLFSQGGLFGGGDPFLTLHREMNRLFDEVMRGGSATAQAQGTGQPGMLLAPSMDVTESDGEMRIQAELPGVDEKDVELSLTDDILTLRAEKRQQRKQEREGVHFSERSYGTFQRSLRLPFQVDPSQVKAQFQNGVLTITLPKGQQQQRSRRIQIQGAQGAAQLAGQGGDGQGMTVNQKAEGGDEAGSAAVTGH